MSESIRINKYIAESGYCSRRQADKLIQERKVKLNGKTAVLGDQVSSSDKIEIAGKIIKPVTQKIYIALHKPYGVITTTDKNSDNNIMQYIDVPQRLFPIGRLDVQSSGLILLSNDGEIVNTILKSKYKKEKEYMVTVDKPLTPVALSKLQNGVFIDGEKTLPAKVIKVSPNQFLITIIQGKNRQIRRMCEALGYEVKILKRVRIGNIQLGDLARGKWRHLTNEEIADLKKS